MVGIVDYGVGNLFSLVSSFAAIGMEAVASGDPEVLLKADRLVILTAVEKICVSFNKPEQRELDEMNLEPVGNPDAFIEMQVGLHPNLDDLVDDH